jgi:hypothetical protein
MGMFGARSAAQQVAAGGDGMDPSTAKPRFFDQGGAGRPIAGYIGDALLNMSGNKPVYAPMMQQQRQQQAELARMMQMAQWKQANPDPTSMQRNYEYLKGIRPDLGESYLRAEANPQTLMTDPTTGAVGFFPKGGAEPAADGALPTVSDAASYGALAPGAHFKDPEGNIRVKP